MADIQVWQNLPRSTVDNTKIDEAIAEAIDAHNDDTDAHLLTDQALEVHRQNEIIDHPAESVPNDKLQINNRNYSAIVDPTSEVDFDTVQSAVDFCQQRGGGDILIARGVHYVTSTLTMFPSISLFGYGIDETIVHFSGATDYYINTNANIVNDLFSGLVVDCTNASAQIDVSGIDTGLYPDLVGLWVDTYNNGDILPARILSYDGGDTFTVSETSDYTGTNASDAAYPDISYVNGSRFATVTWPLDQAPLPIAVGYRLWTPDMADWPTVIAITDGNILTFADEYSGDTEHYIGNGSFNSAREVKIEDMTITTDSTDSFINATRMIKMSDVDLTHDGLVRFAAGSVIQDCIFRMGANTYFNTASSELNNFLRCDFRAGTTAREDIITSGYHQFDTCRFYRYSTSSINVLDCMDYNNRFINCMIQQQRSINMNPPSYGTGDFQPAIIDCMININTSHQLQIQGTRMMFIGNYMSGTANAFNLTSGSSNCIVANNVGDQNFTNSGTNNALTGNITY